MTAETVETVEVDGHRPGTCHFCHRPAEFRPHLGVYADGCDQGLKMLRLWALNDIHRPPGNCPCAQATDGFDAGHGINRTAWRTR